MRSRRHFGASEGEPRQLLDVGRRLADYAGHVDGYVPPLLDRVVADEVAFLRRYGVAPA